MTVAIRPVVQRSVSKSQVVAPRSRRRGSCRCCAVVNFGGRPGAGFAVKALRPRRRTASRQRITELCEHPSRRATSVTDAPAFSSSIPRRRRRSNSSGLPCGRMPRQYRARHQMSITYAHVNNVIVSDKQKHLQYLTMEQAIEHCTKGLSIWSQASNDQGSEPDVVMASAGDIPTKEALAAIVMLRENFPDLKIRFINVVDLLKLTPSSEHPHGLSDRDFDSLFTVDKPIIFNFHGYPWLIHRLAYRRTNHKNMHVRGYKEKGNINTPLDLAIQNQTDRFSLAIDVIDRVPGLQVSGAHAKERLRNMQIKCQNYAYEHGTDRPDAAAWKWPY